LRQYLDAKRYQRRTNRVSVEVGVFFLALVYDFEVVEEDEHGQEDMEPILFVLLPKHFVELSQHHFCVELHPLDHGGVQLVV